MLEYDEKYLLDLLQEYKTEETRRARRNLSLFASAVLVAWLLGLELTEIKVLDADLSHASELSVMGLTLIVLVYQAGMFWLSWRRDHAIQNERSYQLDGIVRDLRNSVGPRQAIRERTLEPEHKQGAKLTQAEQALDAYERQKSRTAKATFYNKTINRLELIMPSALGLLAAGILGVGICSALRDTSDARTATQRAEISSQQLRGETIGMPSTPPTLSSALSPVTNNSAPAPSALPMTGTSSGSGISMDGEAISDPSTPISSNTSR